MIVPLEGVRDRAPAEEQPKGCPLCAGSAHAAFTAADLNRGSAEARFRYWLCGSCAVLFLDPVPEDLSPYYPEQYYTLPSPAQLDALADSQRPSVELLLEHTAPGRLVEIGPGEGVFARAALNAGFEVCAVEMDARACEQLRTVVGVEAIHSDRPEDVLARLPPSRAIVMWQVIEHLRAPWVVIERAAANLEPGGVLAISTPNPRSLQLRLLGRRWAHLDAPRHLFLIPAPTLARRCSELGLREVSRTTADASARHWNTFGWEYALRRPPRSRPSSRPVRVLSRLIARAVKPIETRGENGSAYTSLFVKPAP